MKERASVSHFVPAAAAVGLVLIYLAGGGREPEKAKPAAKPRSASTSFDERLAQVDEKKEEWRQRHMPSITDTGEERKEKELYQRMKVLGTSPVEFADDSGGKGGIVVGKGNGELEALLAAGGHYSGPLPDEPQEQPQPQEKN